MKHEKHKKKMMTQHMKEMMGGKKKMKKVKKGM